MAVKTGRAVRALQQSFRRAVDLMETMHNAIQVHPADTEAILPLTTDGAAIRIECRPVVAKVPERANMDSANLYVVFQGWVEVAPEDHEGLMLTTSYATNFGYFRAGHSSVTHALGGHYDFTLTSFAHPRAHMQLRSQASLWHHAVARFRSVAHLTVDADPMMDVLHRVRTPSAQMDFLSFMVQVAADHLVNEGSGQEAKDAFAQLVASCSPLRGYAAGVVDSCACHRSAHWY